MKKLLLCVVLLAGSVQAQMIRSYQGATYKLENESQCLLDFQNIVRVVEAQKDFQIIDGGCVQYGEKHVSLKFDYSHPITKDIERANFTYADAKTCNDELVKLATTITEAGNVHVAAFCVDKKVNLDYIDLTYSMIRDLNIGVRFETLNECLTFNKKNKTELAKLEMRVLFEACSESRNLRDEISYHPVSSLIANYQLKIEVLRGKALTQNSQCLENIDEIRTAMNDNEFTLVNAFCAHTSSYDKENREHLIYVKKSIFTNLKQYTGVLHNDLATCEAKLETIKAKLANLKLQNTYSYCEKRRGDKFQPIAYYIEKTKID